DNTLSEIDVASGKVVKQTTVGLEPDAVAVTPNGALALVANFGDNTVTPVALPSLRPGRPLAVGRQPVAIAVAPAGNLALVANYQDGSVSPIDLSTLVAGSPASAGAEPEALFITPDGTTALVADFQTSVVLPINLATMTPEPAIAVGSNPTGIAGLPLSSTAYVRGGGAQHPPDRSADAPAAGTDPRRDDRRGPLHRPGGSDRMGVRGRRHAGARQPGQRLGDRASDRRQPAVCRGDLAEPGERRLTGRRPADRE